MRQNIKLKKRIALTLICIMVTELVEPNVALALTSGPSQPEVQSFEPIGTTDMVNMFGGDFVYNIPLLDVEGYPLNIAYHGGITPEQEASWVGLGWNLNPGSITRSIRGVPDDFKGDVLGRELHIKDEKTTRIGLGVGMEIVGSGDPKSGISPVSASASAELNVNINNYRGVSCDFTLGGGVNVFQCISLGVNAGIGSQTGATVNYHEGLGLSSAMFINKDLACGIGIGADMGYNTRSGIKDLSWSASFTGSSQKGSPPPGLRGQGTKDMIHASSRYEKFSSSIGISHHVPAPLQNYIPVITNSSTMKTIFGRVKLGGELFWCYGYGTIKAMFSRMHYENDGSRPSYGYLYLQNANRSSILDFTRDKDGMFNKNMRYLPPAAMTYDIYNVTGHGAGGQYRPYRNDFGSVFDPATTSEEKSNSFGLEVGAPPNLFEIGIDYARMRTKIESGPWDDYYRKYTPNDDGSSYENCYFRDAGELTATSNSYAGTIRGSSMLTPEMATGLPDRKPISSMGRDARGNLLYYNTAAQEVLTPDIYSYNDDGFVGGANPTKVAIPRIGGGRKSHHISEVTQLQTDGTRYIYGIPAMNNSQKEATFSVDAPSGGDLAAGLVPYAEGSDDAMSNGKGIDNYYASTSTPAYAHSYLLTSVLSTDYVDVTGDGATDDDPGSYTKLNYSLKSADYKWKSPFASGKAQYNPGFWSEPRDDKGSYVSGSREQWYLHSIETKNFIAEFYTSKRSDALDATMAAKSYKLDSIKLYNKHDRFINGSNAVPIKSVFFAYDYSLCPGVPNSGAGGKLTLKRIYFRYGNSQRSMISPYQFDYRSNFAYDAAAKNRWGDYKPNPSAMGNYEFPFVDQRDASNDDYASAWTMSAIHLPSGGTITIEYEADDYAYVQNKETTEMFKIKGIGSGPEFEGSTQLYWDKNSPLLYAYFDRKLTSEIGALSFRENYLKDMTAMYYNFDVKLADKTKTFEQIKGYATITDIGPCSDGQHGYIRFKPVTIEGGGAIMNPVCYTALNVSRYNLPQIIFPGSDPDESSLHEILMGLKEAFLELINRTRNPIIRFLVKNQAQEVNLQKSFVRLQCTGRHKKGGGQRVKQMLFYDSWNALSGGNEPDATYGKTYDYTTQEGAAMISSGVASYEPLVGGDENPLRVPLGYYDATTGSTFNDPVDLYQEGPVGESFYPGPSVGYSKITVGSINAGIAKSAQSYDVYQFYTSKEFPAECLTSAIQTTRDHTFNPFRQNNKFEATQGFSLTFNDMHGKPKSVEHYAYSELTQTSQPITYQVFKYKGLDNNVSCLVGSRSGGMAVETRQVGVETDYALDSRHKKEFTTNFALNTNLNVSVFFVPIPIPLIFPWYGEYLNEFKSATVTKITQKYGILDEVINYNEGAQTIIKNELFDPNTGDVLSTSVNNEYNDREYTFNIPASACYDGMSAAYTSIKYEFSAATLHIDSNRVGKLLPPDGHPLHVGDECLVSYYADGVPHTTTLWVIDGRAYAGPVTTPPNYICPGIQVCCAAYLLPRFPFNALTPGWTKWNVLTNLHFTVMRSGARNMLTKDIENFTTLRPPTIGGTLNSYLTSAINLTARTYSDSTSAIPRAFLVYPDTINPYVIGERGNYRLHKEFTYVNKRDYPGAQIRNHGLFDAPLLFSNNSTSYCLPFPYRYLGYYFGTGGPNWVATNTITRWSPQGNEIENMDAVGNYSTAVFRYNHQLPVAVATNAQQRDILADGFEDYALLRPVNNYLDIPYSPFDSLFTPVSFVPGYYNLLQLSNPLGFSVTKSAAHSGDYSITTNAINANLPDAYQVRLPIYSDASFTNNRYNLYYNFGISGPKAANEYSPFKVVPGHKYILSYWIKSTGPASDISTYALSSNWGIRIGTFGPVQPVVKKSNIIDGWQQVEVTFNVPLGTGVASLTLPSQYYIDDIRILPVEANMKAFVYNSVNERLMATLDENNFATFFEYDQEGNLVRSKKETEKGIITLSESRSSNPLNK